MLNTIKIQRGIARTKTKSTLILTIFSVIVVGIGTSLGLFPAFAGADTQNVVYNNIPSPTPGNVPSIGFEATSTSEFGGQVALDGTQRKDPKITVLMSSWACKSGNWYSKNCITNKGSTFTHPITIKIYNVNPDNSVGSLIKSSTKTFSIPYRPTADDGTNCNDSNGPTGAWWDGNSCYNGKAFNINFELNGITLPDNVIVGVAYNTSHYGYSPIGNTSCNSTPQGCAYDSLNVGTNPVPSVGSAEPSINDAYYSTSYGGFYCDNGVGGIGLFRLDAGCWTDYLPAIKIEASTGKPGHHGKHNNHYDEGHHDGGKNHHKKHTGAQGFYNIYSD